MSAKPLRVLWVLAGVLAVGGAMPALDGAPYDVIDLGVGRQAYDINAANQVIGCVLVSGIDRARLWQVHPDASVTSYDLHADITSVASLDGTATTYTFGMGMNDAGDVAGWIKDGPVSMERAFFASPNGGGSYDVVDLDTAFGTSTNPLRRA